jgi:predicted RNase H-like nuclease (RuvC/YqgF family)
MNTDKEKMSFRLMRGVPLYGVAESVSNLLSTAQSQPDSPDIDDLCTRVKLNMKNAKTVSIIDHHFKKIKRFLRNNPNDRIEKLCDEVPEIMRINRLQNKEKTEIVKKKRNIDTYFETLMQHRK